MPSTTRARSPQLVLGLCAFAALLGALGLIGHLFDVEALDAMISGRPRMQAGAAILIILSAAGVALRRHPEVTRSKRAGSVLLGASVLTFGALIMAEYLFALDLGIDVQRAVTPAQGPHPGRPSPLTASALAALGATLLTFDVRSERRAVPREGLSLLAIFVAFVSLVGHLFGTDALYELAGSFVIGVALPTALALFALGSAALLARPQVGLMQLATSEGPGGVLLRRLTLAAVLVGPLLGVLLLGLTDAVGLTDLPLILALGNVFAVFLSVLLVVTTALPLERTHRTAEQRLARIAELVEYAPHGIFVADLSGRYTEVNEAGCRLLGLSREQILGKTITDLLPPEDVERLWQSRAKMLQGQAETDEWRLRRGDGTYVDVEVTAKILPDGRWQGFAQDITERVELKRKLLESRDFLQRVLESATEYGIIAEDLERRVVLWNEGARRVYGYEDHEIFGRTSEELVAQTELGAWSTLRARGLERGTASGTILARRRDGSTFAANVACTRRLGADNRPAGVLWISRDLSVEQRHLAEQAFLAQVGIELASCLEYRETLARVAELATSFLGDVCAVDVPRDGVARRVQLTLRDPSKQEAAQVLSEVTPHLLGAHPIWEVLESKQAVIVPERGEELITRLATSPEHAAALRELGLQTLMLVPLVARGQLLAVLCIGSCAEARGYDEGDLRLAEDLGRRAALTLDNVQLFQQSRLQGAMTTHLSEGAILIRATDATIVYANPRFEAMFGYAPRELIGKPVHVLNAPGDLGAEERARHIVAELDRQGIWQGELENIRKDGARFWCRASVSTFEHEEHGRVWISVHSDITERKSLEEQNERALRDKEILLKEIHHRVKNNLQVISSLFSLQEERTQSAELKSLLDESRTRVQAIALVHDQLYRSADLAVIDFDEYLRGLVAAIGSSYGAQLVEITASAEGVVLEVEVAVPCALLVCELVSNSLKHAFAGGPGKVQVRAHRDRDGFCVLEVADDGCGIATDLDWAKSRSLGLRLVQSFVRQLRGTLTLDRSSGTRFTARFPLGQTERARRPRPAELHAG
jgi:PAS domain S-box-containing protein